MGLKATDLRDFVVRPTLNRLGLWSPAAEALVIGTALTESGGLVHLDQTTPGPGPAYGLWQMEEATHYDLWVNFIPGQPSALRDALLEIAGVRTKYLSPPVTLLHGNLFYGAAMCRMHYRRMPGAIPDAHDFEGMAEYWKRYYNTPLGKGTVAKALPYFMQAVNL